MHMRVDALAASPHREIMIAPSRSAMPVRDAVPCPPGAADVCAAGSAGVRRRDVALALAGGCWPQDGTQLSRPDLIIAAIGRQHGLAVLTRDTSDHARTGVALLTPPT